MHKLALTALLALAAPIGAQQQVCTINTYAPGCGPVLNASFQPLGGGSRQLLLQASGLFPHSIGAMVWGLDDVQTPIVGNCILHTRYIWGTTFMSDSQGNHVWQRAWPGSFHGFFRIQMGTLQAQPFDVKTTNAVIAECHLE